MASPAASSDSEHEIGEALAHAPSAGGIGAHRGSRGGYREPPPPASVGSSAEAVAEGGVSGGEGTEDGTLGALWGPIEELSLEELRAKHHLLLNAFASARRQAQAQVQARLDAVMECTSHRRTEAQLKGRLRRARAAVERVRAEGRVAEDDYLDIVAHMGPVRAENGASPTLTELSGPTEATGPASPPQPTQEARPPQPRTRVVVTAPLLSTLQSADADAPRQPIGRAVASARAVMRRAASECGRAEAAPQVDARPNSLPAVRRVRLQSVAEEIPVTPGGSVINARNPRTGSAGAHASKSVRSACCARAPRPPSPRAHAQLSPPSIMKKRSRSEQKGKRPRGHVSTVLGDAVPQERLPEPWVSSASVSDDNAGRAQELGPRRSSRRWLSTQAQGYASDGGVSAAGAAAAAAASGGVLAAFSAGRGGDAMGPTHRRSATDDIASLGSWGSTRNGTLKAAAAVAGEAPDSSDSEGRARPPTATPFSAGPPRAVGSGSAGVGGSGQETAAGVVDAAGSAAAARSVTTAADIAAAVDVLGGDMQDSDEDSSTEGSDEEADESGSVVV